MYASRTRSRSCPPVPNASRSAPIASPSTSNGANASPSLAPRCSITSSHHRSASSYPAVSARTASGSIRTASAGSDGSPPGSPSPCCSLFSDASCFCSSPSSRPHASVWVAGRSMKRAGTPWSRAQRMATHSGENSASGQNADRPGSSTTCARRATGGRMSSSAASAINASASGGPSMSTVRGPAASSAARTARAEPGPWWRTPSSRGPVPPSRSLTRSPPGRRGRSPSSRRARGRPLPDTPAR